MPYVADDGAGATLTSNENAKKQACGDAAERGIIFFDATQVYGPFVNEEFVAKPSLPCGTRWRSRRSWDSSLSPIKIQQQRGFDLKAADRHQFLYLHQLWRSANLDRPLSNPHHHLVQQLRINGLDQLRSLNLLLHNRREPKLGLLEPNLSPLNLFGFRKTVLPYRQ